jgi:hypothetical protein
MYGNEVMKFAISVVDQLPNHPHECMITAAYDRSHQQPSSKPGRTRGLVHCDGLSSNISMD